MSDQKLKNAHSKAIAILIEKCIAICNVSIFQVVLRNILFHLRYESTFKQGNKNHSETIE